jgi:hypothetical protein
MFPIFRGWSLRILAIVTYENATRSVAVDYQWTLYTTALGATPQYVGYEHTDQSIVYVYTIRNRWGSPRYYFITLLTQ